MSSWRAEEDARLLEAVVQHGSRDAWGEIAVLVGGGRSRKACRQRYKRLVPPEEDVEEPDVIDPVAVLQTRRDPEFHVPAGMTIFDLESGRGITQQGMDTFHEKIRETHWPKIAAKLREMGHDVDDYENSAFPIEVLEDLFDQMPELLDMDFGGILGDLMTEPEPEESPFDQAVASMVMQLGPRRDDAEEAAVGIVRRHIEQAFGADADVKSPEVDAFLREYVDFQMSHMSRERPAEARHVNQDPTLQRIAHDIRLKSGKFVRLMVVTDPKTGKQHVDRAYSDMEIIEKYMETFVVGSRLTARKFVDDCRPDDLLHLLSGIGDEDVPRQFSPTGPCARSVKQNAERLYALTGHPITTPYVSTPMQVHRYKKWKNLLHCHGKDAPGSDRDDRFPYKNGLSILHTDGELLINEFSPWMGKSWVHAAYLIDTTTDHWKVKNYVLFCYGKDLNTGEPYPPGYEDTLDRCFESYVDGIVATKKKNEQVHGAKYTWTTTRPSRVNESMAKPILDNDRYPVLVELGRSMVHSARTPSTRVPEAYARRLRSGEERLVVIKNSRS